MTKREVINEMLANEVITSNENWTEFLNHEIELLDKKAESRKNAQTKAQKANAELKTEVLPYVTTEGSTVTEILARVDSDKIATSQKMTAILKSLVADGTVVNVKEGKKSIYKLA